MHLVLHYLWTFIIIHPPLHRRCSKLIFIPINSFVQRIDKTKERVGLGGEEKKQNNSVPANQDKCVYKDSVCSSQ